QRVLFPAELNRIGHLRTVIRRFFGITAHYMQGSGILTYYALKHHKFAVGQAKFIKNNPIYPNDMIYCDRNSAPELKEEMFVIWKKLSLFISLFILIIFLSA